MSDLTTGDSYKEHGNDQLPPTGRIQEGPKERRRHQPIISPVNVPEILVLESILAKRCRHHQEGPESDQTWARARWLARDNPESSPHYLKTRGCEPRGRAVLLGSLTLLLSAQTPLPNKGSHFVESVSPWTIYFWMLDKSPLPGPGRGHPFDNNSIITKPSARIMDLCWEEAGLAWRGSRWVRGSGGQTRAEFWYQWWEAPAGCVNNTTPGNCQHSLSACWRSYSRGRAGAWWCTKGQASRPRRQGTHSYTRERWGPETSKFSNHPALWLTGPSLRFPFLPEQVLSQVDLCPSGSQLTASRQAWTWPSPSNEPV